MASDVMDDGFVAVGLGTRGQFAGQDVGQGGLRRDVTVDPHARDQGREILARGVAHEIARVDRRRFDRVGRA